MRAETKKRLLAVLEDDLRKVNANINRDFFEEWEEAEKLVTQLYNRGIKTKKVSELQSIELQLKKAQIARDKAQKLAFDSTKKLEAWMQEKYRLIDEIQELNSAFFYVRTD